tara:strand:+ start:3914 stop:5326 length:1413 start_codon:yes stop_codon:yes gene_type:complete
MATWKKVLVSGSSAELSALTLDTQLAVGQGGTGATTLTDGGVLLGSGTGAISATAVLGNGELLIGDNSGDPTVATLTGTSNEVEISNGAGSITIGLPNDVTIGQDLTVTRNLSNSGAVADSQITGSFTGSFSGDGSNLTGLTSANNSTITLSPGAGLAALGDFTLNQAGDETITIGVDGVLEDLDTLGAAGSDGQFIVATGEGAFAYESGATARASLGVDAAGTDNSTDVTLVTTSHDYLSISGQAITLGQIDIGDDTNLAAGDGLALSGDSLAVNVDDATIEINSDNVRAKTAAIADGGTALATADQIHTFYTAGGANLATALNTDLGGDFIIGNQSDDTAKFTGDLTVGGDLNVNGTLTSINSTNLNVKDQFIFAASGSTAANVDGGLIVQEGSNHNTGSAFYHDTDSNRWAVAKNIPASATAVTPLQHVVTTTLSTSNPVETDAAGGYGVGEMWVETDTQDIYIRTN